jgi:hypothetical protein
VTRRWCWLSSSKRVSETPYGPSMTRRLLAGAVGVVLIGACAGCGSGKAHRAQSVNGPGPTASVEVSSEAPNQPPTAEVEQDMRNQRDAREESAIFSCHRQHTRCPPRERPNHVSCHELQAHHWSCQLRFPDGEIELVHAVWYGAQRTLGISVEARTGPTARSTINAP